jgi:Phosphate-selective porin O and P
LIRDRLSRAVGRETTFLSCGRRIAGAPVFIVLVITCAAQVAGQAPPAAPPAPPPAAPAPETKLPVELKVDGYANADMRHSFAEEGPRTFLLRRARLGVTGTAYKFIDFRYLMEFAASDASSTATVQDAYLNVRFLPQLQFQAGQFKVPFAREWATNAAGSTSSSARRWWTRLEGTARWG